MVDLLDQSIREKYRQYFINDPLEFMRKAVDWSAFPPLLKELYHNDMDKGGAPDIPVTTMVKVLFLQSIYSISDEQIEKEIHDRISFMNFLDYPDGLPDSTTIWMFREGLSTTGGIKSYGMNCRGSSIQRESRSEKGRWRMPLLSLVTMVMKSIMRQWSFERQEDQKIKRSQRRTARFTSVTRVIS